jgi:hypothetical protein
MDKEDCIMDENWRKEVEHLPLEEQWHMLYKWTKPIRAEGKAIWKGGWGIDRKTLIDMLKSLGVKKIIDCGCADHHWLSKMDWTGIDYLGIDIVPELIEQNKKNFPDKNFQVGNIVNEIPTGDIIFIRDVFTHLKLEDCLQVVENVKRSGSKYLMISSSSGKENLDTSCLILYPRNLRIEPFNFPDPILTIKDKGKEGYYMGIWDIDEL